MTANGHVARARSQGNPANRTLVRNVVQLMLRNPGAPAYLYYDRNQRRMFATDGRPSHGVWRQVGPHDIEEITILALAQEIEHLAQECRTEVAGG